MPEGGDFSGNSGGGWRREPLEEVIPNGGSFRHGDLPSQRLEGELDAGVRPAIAERRRDGEFRRRVTGAGVVCRADSSSRRAVLELWQIHGEIGDAAEETASGSSGRAASLQGPVADFNVDRRFGFHAGKPLRCTARQERQLLRSPVLSEFPIWTALASSY